MSHSEPLGEAGRWGAEGERAELQEWSQQRRQAHSHHLWAREDVAMVHLLCGSGVGSCVSARLFKAETQGLLDKVIGAGGRGETQRGTNEGYPRKGCLEPLRDAKRNWYRRCPKKGQVVRRHRRSSQGPGRLPPGSV